MVFFESKFKFIIIQTFSYLILHKPTSEKLILENIPVKHLV